ncbi:TPM domain-containing protein [Modestobacter sp. NPDC049651]|uniref:TPM domain-containing protein n=1 Tax=unclassified Modestobacter TaxID=2643866 RepID=UPI00340EBBB8
MERVPHLRRPSAPRPVALLLAVLTALAAVLLVPGTASAEAPGRLTERVTDSAGVLGNDADEVRDTVDRLASDEGIGLYVVFVNRFDGTADPDAWAAQAARATGLGRSDAVFAVATGERRFGVYAGGAFAVDEVRQLDQQDVRPQLSDSDWAGAVSAFADGLPGARQGSSGASSSSNSGGGGGGGAVLVTLVLIALVGGGAYLFFRGRRRKAAELAAQPQTRAIPRPDPHAGVPTEQLNYRASQALLDLDERARTAGLDLDFARAQYGAEAVPGLDQELAAARDELARAFAIRQLLDDEIPEDEPTQRRMLTDLLGLTGSADRRLAAQNDALGQLRDRERTAPQALEELTGRMAELQQRLPQAEQRLADLQGRYAESAVGPVQGNVAEAGTRLAAAGQALTQARTAVESGETGRSVAQLRTAEDAVAQSATLLDSVERLAADLAAAEQRLPAARAGVEGDLAEARAAAGGPGAGDLRAPVARAEAALASADELLRPRDGSRPDPLAALRRLEEADTALDQALESARDARVQAQRAAAALDQALLTARSGVAAAGDFISTRRGAVGSEARTRLAEAERHLSAAVSGASSDPVAGLREAQLADRLAQDSLRLAQDDVSRWSQQTGYGWGGGGYGGGGYGGGGFGGGGYGGGYGGGFGRPRGGGMGNALGWGLGGLVLGGLLSGGGHDNDYGAFGGGDFGGGDFGGGDFGGGDFGGGDSGSF